MSTALEAEAQRLATRVSELHTSTPSDVRILIGVCGIPGAGKSTVSEKVSNILNRIFPAPPAAKEELFAANVPMDGFHYSRAHLAGMPDPATAIHRRGAAFTYDAEGFYDLVRKLRTPRGSEVILAPSFDHATKDPVADSIVISPGTRVVILEGNYLALDREPWRSSALLLDEIWLVDVDKEVAQHRLAKRHVASGIVENEEAAYERIRTTDFLNADDIMDNLLTVHEVVRAG